MRRGERRRANGSGCTTHCLSERLLHKWLYSCLYSWLHNWLLGECSLPAGCAAGRVSLPVQTKKTALLACRKCSKTTTPRAEIRARGERRRGSGKMGSRNEEDG